MKLYIISFLLVIVCSPLFGQTGITSKQILKQSLIAGDRGKVDRRNRSERFHFDQYYYKMISSLIVDDAYTKMYSLSKENRKQLLKALKDANTEQGISIDEIHAVIGSTMKDVLTYNQYMQWAALSDYPEYRYFQ